MSINVTIRKDLNLGTWRGMGGAITEATAYNFAKLSPKKQQKLLDAYYGKDGLDYRWCRISIGSNDFCLKSFEYTKKNNLRDFSIEHDKKWVLPMLQKVIKKQKDLQIIASPWSPPKCLKLPPIQRYGGILAPWHYGTYAKYIHRWLDAYAKEGVDVKYLTPQNEPRAIQIWESCVYSFRAQRRLANYLAEELRNTDVKILMWDHNKEQLTKVADRLLRNGDEKIVGLCYHWYDGTHPNQMWQVRQKHPGAMMLASEMCVGFSPYDPADWATAANPYYFEIMSDINTGASAWLDWNMLLSWQGGPSYCKNYVKSPAILNDAGDDFILTPIYDALKKFARLFPVGSQIARCEYDSKDIAVVARKTKNSYEVVIANTSDQKQEVEIKLGKQNKRLSLNKLEIRKVTF
jgi:O-Glycosyl hydrolase